VRIALVQMRCKKGDIRGNLDSIGEAITAAEARGIELIVFPEMSITGYIDPTRRPDAVLALDSGFVEEFVLMTDGSNVTAIAGCVEHNPNGKPFITQIVAASGEYAGWYRKRNVVDEELEWFAPGPSTACVFTHDTMTVGLAICADIDAPQVFRDSARAGAHLIVESAAPGLYGQQATRDWQAGYDWWRGQCHTKLGEHARVNGVYIAVSTQAGRTIDEDFPGGGYLFGPDGMCLAETDDWSECVLDVEIPDGA